MLFSEDKLQSNGYEYSRIGEVHLAKRALQDGETVKDIRKEFSGFGFADVTIIEDYISYKADNQTRKFGVVKFRILKEAKETA